MGNVKVIFIPSYTSPPPRANVLVWGKKKLPNWEHSDTIKVIRLEDGFIRSVGLGADLVDPISWVIDPKGIYFDSTSPSELESILSTTDFDALLQARASRLRISIVNTGLTKYNIRYQSWQRPENENCVILVPGQVESDASIEFGAPNICTNRGLLEAVRLENPHAFIVYKPHPDVVAGLRKQDQTESDFSQWCDQLVTESSIVDLLEQVDEVHVMTSLTGFEALLREKKVVCYGQPFYAGWGLTVDKVPIHRRVRSLNLDALVAGTLILYPTYVSLKNSEFITPESAIEELLYLKKSLGKAPALHQKLLRFILRLLAY